MISIKIDGKKLDVEKGTTLLQAAEELGISIPTLCHLDSLEPKGTCGLCFTEIEIGGKKKLVAACTYAVDQPLKADTQSERVTKSRRKILGRMTAQWPNVPTIKEFVDRYGAEPPAKERPVINDKEEACILCGRCVRACAHITWENVLEFSGRGKDRQVIMRPNEKADGCTGCGTCAMVCPTGVIKVSAGANNPVDPKRIAEWGFKVSKECANLDAKQFNMRKLGTANLVEIMNAYDLLPVNNFKFGEHPEAKEISSPIWKKLFTQNMPDGCWPGCMLSCVKVIEGLKLQTGPYKGEAVHVSGPEYETAGACGSCIGVFDPLVIAEINFYCDTYSVDTISFGTATAFVMECYENGILDKDVTGGLDLNFGMGLNALELLHQMARGEGFGVVVGSGIRQMKQKFIDEYGADPQFVKDIGMECKGLEYSQYISKESLAQQGGYALASKGPQHDEAWLIFMDMVNKQIPTFKDKAEALHYFPMFRTWFGLMGLCKLPWNDIEPTDNKQKEEPAKVPSHVEGYRNFYAGMTGKEITTEDLIVQSERVYNFQRVFNLRMGYGKREHDRGPYRAMGPVTEEEYLSREERYDKQLKELVGKDPEGLSTLEKIKVLRVYREDQYEQLLDAVYERRGWTKDGVPTIETLKRLSIDFPWLKEVVKPHL